MPSFILLLFGAALSGCVGPLVLHETARTVGDNHNELMGGYGRAGAAIKWTYGLARSLDMGIQFESLSTTAHLKYAWINNRERGWSLASALGGGLSIGGRNYFLDTTVSHLDGNWEPYFNWRFVRMTIDSIEARDHDTGEITFSTSRFSYTYAQAMLGTRYWMTPHWILSLELSDLIALTNGIQISGFLLYGAAVGYRF